MTTRSTKKSKSRFKSVRNAPRIRREMAAARFFHPMGELLEDRRLLTAAPAGSEFRINQVASGVQKLDVGSEAVGVDAAGNFAVVYTSQGSNKSVVVFVQRYSADGTPIGGQLRANQFTTGDQDLASIAMRPDGQFVVTWDGKGANDSSGVFIRRFAANGTPLGNEQRVTIGAGVRRKLDPSIVDQILSAND